MLQLRAAVPAVAGHLRRAERAAAGLAHRYAGATMPGRTWLQQATPITFGIKAAGWADALGRTRRQVQTALENVLVLQLGGAAGTLAALGTRGLAVTDALAARLDLRAAATPWHAHRDRFAQLAGALGVASGAAGKIARDLSLLAQTEVGEAAEGAGPGRGGSSTMPQKRNPVSASVALAAAGRTPGLVATILGSMVQEHERGLGGWQVEWDVLPDVVLVTAGGARATAEALEGLSVDTGRMRANLDATGGGLLAEAVAMALAEAIGKHEAHACVAAGCRRAARRRNGRWPTCSRRTPAVSPSPRPRPDRRAALARQLPRRLAGVHRASSRRYRGRCLTSSAPPRESTMVPDIDADGCRLSWAAQGLADAPALLLLNALGTTVDLWQAQIAPFAAAFRVIRFDTRGHGRSDAPAGPYALDRLGRDALAVLDAAGAGAGPRLRSLPRRTDRPLARGCTRQNDV